RRRRVADPPGYAGTLALPSQQAHLLEGSFHVLGAEPDPLHHRHLLHRTEEDAVAVLDDALEPGRRGAVDARILGQLPNGFRDVSGRSTRPQWPARRRESPRPRRAPRA